MKNQFKNIFLCGSTLAFLCLSVGTNAAEYAIPDDYLTLESLRVSVGAGWMSGDTIRINGVSDNSIQAGARFNFGANNITVTGSGAITPNNTSANTNQFAHLQYDAALGTTLSLTAHDGATLAFNQFNSSNIASATGGVVHAGDTSSTSNPLNTLIRLGAIGSTGTLLFSNNTAEFGSAVNSDGDLAILGGINTFNNNKAMFAGVMGAYNTVISGGTNTFTNNTATFSGGVIYSPSGRNLIISGGANTFSGNTATSMSGGAVYCYGVTVSGSANTFTHNEAGSAGGAIYITRSGTLLADNGDILFQGNIANHTANAIHAGNINGNNTLILSAKGNNRIFFDDPIASDDLNQNLVIKINTETDGATPTNGEVIFDGAYWLSQSKTPNADADYFTSTVYGNTSVYGGRMMLQNGVTYHSAGAGNAFTLNTGATLALSNNNLPCTNTVEADTIRFSNNSTLAFDLANADNSGTLSNLTLIGATNDLMAANTLRFAVHLDSYQEGTFMLVDANQGDFTNFNAANALSRLTGLPAGLSAAFYSADNGSKLMLTLTRRDTPIANAIPTMNTGAYLLLAIMLAVAGWYFHRSFASKN